MTTHEPPSNPRCVWEIGPNRGLKCRTTERAVASLLRPQLCGFQSWGMSKAAGCRRLHTSVAKARGLPRCSEIPKHCKSQSRTTFVCLVLVKKVASTRIHFLNLARAKVYTSPDSQILRSLQALHDPVVLCAELRRSPESSPDEQWLCILLAKD